MISKLLLNTDVLGVESLPTLESIRAADQMFDKSDETPSYVDMPLDTKQCFDTAVKDDSKISRQLLSHVKNQHIARLQILLSQSSHFDPGIQAYPGLDWLLLAKAKEFKVRTIEVEGLAESFSFDLDMPTQEILGNIRALCEAANDPLRRSQFRSFNSKFALHYLHRGLAEQARRELLKFESLQGISANAGTVAALDKRNLKMSTRIMEILRNEKRSVVVVGMLHLTGTQAIQNLLSSAGAKVSHANWNELVRPTENYR